jgi:REP-associated tyrosine transposase
MPRAARCVVAGLPLHVVQRGISRNPCFFAERDYAVYLRFLGAFSDEFDCSVHAYCLMTNHVHLLVTPSTRDACALLMKKLGQCYVQYVNHNLGRTGTLWEGRFRSCMVNSDNYVLACYRYIELNPVRAGMVSAPCEYRWSSYRVNARGEINDLITAHSAYEALNGNAALRCCAYRQLCESAPPSRIEDEIRKATRLGVLAGAVRRARGRPTKVK